MQAVYPVSDSSEEMHPVSEPDNHEDLIVKIAREADRSAFKLLFVHFAPRIKALMIKSGAANELAEDIAQTAMMTVWRKAALFAPERGSASAWVFTIARNARIDRLRRGTSQPYLDIDEMEIAATEPDGEEAFSQSQRSERVIAALGALPPDQRDIIELAYIEDMSQSEIAKKLSLPLGTVKSRMRLAYGRLKTKLEDLQ